MKRIASILFAASLVLVAAGFVSGCKSADEKLCEKLKEIDSDEFADCEKDALPEIKEMCGDNFEAAVECVEGAASEKDAGKCIKDHCKKD